MINKKKRQEYMRKYQKEHPDMYRESNRKYKEKHPDRYKENHRKQSQRWREKYPDQQRYSHMKSNYGLLKEEFLNIIKEQCGLCPICGKELDLLSKRGIHIDHVHDTGKVRGILCKNCNLLLGHAYEKISTLQSAIAYLGREAI